MAGRLLFYLAVSFDNALCCVLDTDVVGLFPDAFEVLVGSLELACKVVELVFAEGDLDPLA